MRYDHSQDLGFPVHSSSVESPLVALLGWMELLAFVQHHTLLPPDVLSLATGLPATWAARSEC
jgi:hypothetical protein